jgi:hypothetical protein
MEETMRFLRMLILPLSLISLIACGGGGGGDATNPEAPTTNQSANGFWSGTLVDNNEGTFSLECLVYEGDLIGVSEDADHIYRGTYTISGNSISGSYKVYQIGGGVVDTGTLSGTVVEQQSINVSFVTQVTTGTIAVTFEQLYNRGSSYALVDGNWRAVIGSDWAQLTVDDAGGITGVDSDGCVVSGVASILNPDHNLYGIDLDLTQCGSVSGSYDGFASLTDGSSENDTLIAVITNDSYILFYSLTRQ